MIKKTKLFSFIIFCFIIVLLTSIFIISPVKVLANKTYDDTNKYWFSSDTVTESTNYGVNWKHILGTSNNGNQQVNMFSMKTDGENSKLVTWMVQNNNSTYIRKTLTEAAKDYEKNHPGWIVIAGINADQWFLKYGTGLGVDGSDKYVTQTYYPYGHNNENIFPVTAMGNSAAHYVGINNQGKLVSPSTIKGTFLSIYDSDNNIIKKIQIAGFNKTPLNNEVTIWSGYYDGGASVYKNMDVSSSNSLAIINNADVAHMNNTTAYADYKSSQAIDSFFGKGAITSNNLSSTSLGKGAFAIDTNNTEIKNLLNVGTYVKVEMEYQSDELNNCESITGYHAVQRENNIDHNVVGSYNTSSYPRSVFGIKDDGTYVLFTSDKGNGYGGLNGWEVNACLKEYGVTSAYQDDGGGSVTAIWRNENNEFDVVNTPRDGSARANLTHLFFVVKVSEYNINYNLDGGYFKYTSYEAMQTEFFNDFCTFNNKTFNKDNFFSGTYSASIQYALNFFNDSTMSKKWGWLLNYFNSARTSCSLKTITKDNNAELRGEIHGFLNNTKFEYQAAAYVNSSDYTNSNIKQKWLSFTDPDNPIPVSYNNIKGIDNLPFPKKDGYTFRGWYNNPNFSGSIVNKIPAGSSGDITLYAKWALTSSLEEYKVTYKLNGGVFTWDNETITPDKGVGIDTVSQLPNYFATDFYNYLQDNDLIESDIIYDEIKYYANCYESFSKKPISNIYSVYNLTKNNVRGSYDGYSQFYFNSISNNEANGGFFGTEPYKSKYQNLLIHIKQLTDIKYPTTTSSEQYKTCFGFALDSYFFGSAGLADTSTENYETYNYLRSVVCTPNISYNGIEMVNTSYLKETFLSDEVLILQAPFKAGHKFIGWYTDENFTNKVESISKSMTVYAKYESLETTAYSVKFYDGDGNIVSDQIVRAGADAFVPHIASKTTTAEFRYKFTGWDQEATNVTSDLIINGVYQEIKQQYTITFLVDGKTIQSTRYEYGETIVPPTNPVKENFVFVGWDQEFSIVTEGLKLNAIFKEKPVVHVVKFYVDGKLYQELTVEEGSNLTEYPIPTKIGYTFTEWDTNLSYISSDITTNAIFMKTIHHVKFYVDGKLYHEEFVEYGQSAKTPTPPTKEGYNFIGWNQDYSFINSDLEVHANFEVIINKGCNKNTFINLSLLVLALYLFRRKNLLK